MADDRSRGLASPCRQTRWLEGRFVMAWVSDSAALAPRPVAEVPCGAFFGPFVGE